MPRLKKATDANGTTFYPISISKGIYDTDRSRRLSETLDDLYNQVTVTYATNAECISAAGELT